MGLTTEQERVVYCDNKLIVCSACPGSGKTYTIVERALRLYEEFREPILICTFSKKATEDIERKIGDSYTDLIEIKTIHSLCYSIVRENWNKLGSLIGGRGWPREPILVSRDQELSLVGEVLVAKGGMKNFETIEKLRTYPVSADTLMRCANRGLYFGASSKREAEIFYTYERERLKRGLINFNDMIDLANEVVVLPEVSLKLSNKWRHILIDEAQDTSDTQWAILKPIVFSADSTLAVGDMNQSLYGFRRANGVVLENLLQSNDTVVFSLTQSFRSSSSIADIANNIVSDKSSQIKTYRGAGEIKVKSFESREEEVNWCIKKKKCTILARTNSYLEQFERECIRQGIPYSGPGFYKAHHIKELAETLKKYEANDAMDLIRKAYLENILYSPIEKEDFKLVIKIVTEHGIDYFLELVNKSQFISNDGILLMTGHAAKGLEWKDVIVVGAQQGHIPHRLSHDEKEERNIMYVMCTRAKDSLSITYSGTPSKFIPEEYLETV